MKKDIHPDYKKTTIKCVCGNEIEMPAILSIRVIKKSLTPKVELKDLKNVTKKNSCMVQFLPERTSVRAKVYCC